MKTTTKKTSPTPSVVTTSTPAVVSGFTLGLDLGDRQHHVCVLDAAGQIIREAALPNTRPALAQLLADFPRATVALEAGTHSPWISRYLTDLGAQVLVAMGCNPTGRRQHGSEASFQVVINLLRSGAVVRAVEGADGDLNFSDAVGFADELNGDGLVLGVARCQFAGGAVLGGAGHGHF